MVGKRKRDGIDGEAEGRLSADTQFKELQIWMKDTLDILRRSAPSPVTLYRCIAIRTHVSLYRHDTTPSTLDRSITSSSNKRIKPSEPTAQASITKLIHDQAYTAIEGLVTDVGTATDEILKDLHQKIEDGSLSVRAVEQETLRASSLKKRLDNLVMIEMMQRPRMLRLRASDVEEMHQDSDEKVPTANMDDNSRVVLTLCGGERSAKQLFSSLAKPDTRNADLGQQALPNGITTSSVVPVHSLEEEKEKGPTIGSTFAPPPGIRPLNAPKQGSKHTSTRGSLVNWHNPTEATITSKDASPRDTYNKQPLSSGQWLTYNVVPSSEQLTSPGSKRRHRDRALSTGEPQSAITEETSAAHAQAKEDALFRSVYSSFAPDHDDFGATVTAEQKNRIWWTRYGEPQYKDLLGMKDEVLYGGSGNGEEDASALPEIDETLVEEAISNWEPQDVPAGMTRDENVSQGPKEADDMLQEISELLEILDSHQRVRNLSQPTNSRALQGQKEQLSSMPGDPTTPSMAELDVYESLKSQLVEVIGRLPPYMLARLDDDKLGAFRLSRKIQIPGKDQKGTLEEDDLSIKAKGAVRPAVSNTAYSSYGGSSALGSGYPSTTPAQQYAQRQSFGQPPAQRQSTVSSSYAAQYPSRHLSASHYPASGARPSYGAQYPPQRTTSSSYTDRYANGAVQQYSHQQPAHSYGQYSSSYRPPSIQHTNSYGQQYSTPQSRIPPASTPAAQAYRGSQTEYQQRAPPPPAYNYGSAQAGMAASPKSSHRSSFSGQAGAAPQQRPPLYHQQSSRYGSHSPAEPQTNGAGSNGPGHMSPDEQTILMNRQKVQLVEQQQTRQASGTPQPTTGQSSRHNGTPAPQPNGVSV
ncbi:MAG: hypothetical protein Q9217_000441 [Psora testacea]